ncbi:uncharacterized protein LOC132386035 isoform X1 [Hypanus sabinus]|uniref:uncharacterized protein LOC132386035 isoform X1 n=1 Tax=Hypanus sabinus TaxID=79690 RepID=UPI0028C42DDF|nr:uncharacterized protein LOC132386035 isoform X1 [Hypanus sabinus]XP_059814308.1 uncharacterized protein LOC132386035 isoform X1 [Hypanus sabinus]
MSAQSSIKSMPPSDKGSKPTSSKPTQALSGVPSAAMSARSGIKSMAPSDKGSRTTSSKSAQARAKAEAAKVRLHYAKQEAVLKMKLATREAEKAAREAERAARKAEAAKVLLRYARQEAVLKMKLATKEAEIQKERAARQREEAAREAEEAAREAEIQKERAARQREEAAREAETQLEMAKISTELQVLQREREKEAAMAEAKYIEEAEGSRDLTAVRSTLERTRLERTSDYVQSQIDRQARLPSPYVFNNFPSYEEPQRVTIAPHPYEEGNLPSRLRDEVKNERTVNAPSPPQQDGGEGEVHSGTTIVSSNWTEVCGQTQSSRSCSEICLTKVYPKGAKDKAIKAYVILDDQSNRSLVSPEFFKLFNIESERFPYYLKTCSGNMKTQGRKAEGIQIESLDGKVVICLPPLLECNEIMNNRAGIPTPSAVLHQPHLHHIAKHIPELDPKAEILLLLGRDVIQVHKVRQQVNGPLDAPFAQRLDLGWVVIGEVCLGDVHKPMVNTLKTNVLESGRHSIFQPCPSVPCIKEAQQDITKRKVTDETLGQSVFVQTEHRNKLAQSAQDTISLKPKDTKVFRDEANNGVAPLPIREPCQRSPDNKEQAVKQFTSLRKTWKRKPEMQQHTLLAHEVLCTLMAEVTAIINAQSFLPVSSDPENPFILSPSTLLTQKAGAPPPPGDFSDKDLYTKQWRQVQALANQFWPRWRQKYLPLLQLRRKWTEPRRNLQVGDLVLLRDKQITRNSWPMARITATFPSEDGHVRKIELKTTDQGDVKIYQRPVTEVILLLPND